MIDQSVNTTKHDSDATFLAGERSDLARLLLLSRVRQLIESKDAVAVSQNSAIASGLISICRKLGFDELDGAEKPPQTRGFLMLILIACLRLYFGPRISLRAAVSSFLGAFRYVRFSQANDYSGFVKSTELERPMIRVCLLLWGKKRYGESIGLLIQRLLSGLPAERTRRFLSVALHEIGDETTALGLESISSESQVKDLSSYRAEPKSSAPNESSATSLNHGIVISTMFDSDVFRASVLSLLDSDFRGEIIVVEDGYRDEKACEAFCHNLPITYIKRPDWEGAQAAALNSGIEQLSPETDIVIYAHSDILWPKSWFKEYSVAWEKVYVTGKVGLINLAFIEPDPSLRGDALLRDVFAGRNYDDLLWTLGYPGADLMLDIKAGFGQGQFGLGRCRFNDKAGRLHFMTGRASPAASFPIETWREMGGLDTDLPYAWDSMVHWYGYENRKWNLWIDNAPLIHFQGMDTIVELADDIPLFTDKEQQTRLAFEEKFGWDMGHFIFTYFAETSIIYHDEIVSAANQLRFEDIDFVFDDFWTRLKGKTLDNCELSWCQSRSTCKYVGTT